MKGKKEFTRKEAKEIERLITEKLMADKQQQKRIRDKIRAIGFYITDFSTKRGYTVQDFRDAVTIIDR